MKPICAYLFFAYLVLAYAVAGTATNTYRLELVTTEG